MSKTESPPTPWFEDETIWVATYPFLFGEGSFQTAAAEIQKIIALTGCAAGGAVLDLCCGPGRHAIPFAKAGFSVTGVDRSPFLLAQAEDYARREMVKVAWVQEDMRRFVRPDAFTLAVNLFSAFGYFDDISENQIVLQSLYSSLRPDGLLVMEMTGKERLAKIFQPTGSTALPNGDVLFERRSILGDWEQIDNEWVIVRGTEAKSFRLRLWIFSARELKELLRGAGFRDVKIFGSFDGAPYGLEANRLIAVARK